MNFHKLTERLDIIEEARTGQFETLFQTGYLKKAMLDKGIAVPRPLVFEFIVDFLTDKGLVPDNTVFQSSRYAADAGAFIKSLVDSGLIKPSIADEFKGYIKDNLPSFIQRKFQTTKHRTGEFSKKQQIEPGEERGKASSELAAVKTPEEIHAAELARREERKSARAAAKISPDADFLPSERKEELVWSTSKEQIEHSLETDRSLHPDNLSPLGKRVKDAAFKLLGNPEIKNVDDYLDALYFYCDSTITKKMGAAAGEKATATVDVIRNVIDKALEQSEAKTIKDVERSKKLGELSSAAKRSGIDTGGSEMGDIESKPEPTGFEDNEEQVQKESYTVKYVSTRDRFKPKTIWQKIQQQQDRYYL